MVLKHKGRNISEKDWNVVRYVQGPVVQTPIKLILDLWKILIVIYLLLKNDFSQN